MTFASSLVQNFNYNQRQGSPPSTNGSFTWTIPTGVANINTTTKQFGTGSMYGNTSGGYIQTTTTNTFMNVGTGDFTIEGWLYIPTARNTALPSASNGSSINLIVNNVTGGLGIRLGQQYQGNVNNISLFARAQADLDFASYVWPLDQWNHVVAQRSQTGTSEAQVAFWANGRKLTRAGTSAVSRNFVNSGAATAMTIGSYNSGSTDETMRNAFFDEICVTVGSYRYDPQGNVLVSSSAVGNVVVPISSFVVDTPTRLLMHMDGTSGSTTFTNATS